ncbi:CcdB family protein [Caballeronia sp. AZ10_KS36]|uniref:CcdB family protein n=1 Tax=Caballeronia sp. AZ10_KS36 TaxID=2921757 RepID=UPI002027FF32|nr:CcdB family protein [Caballeronia sp. AZ10_KS36]
MARFDVFRESIGHASTPYIAEVQRNRLSGLATRVVIPLRRLDRLPVVPLPPDLIPVFVIEGIECMLDTPTLAAIPRSALTKPVSSLVHRQDEICRR